MPKDNAERVFDALMPLPQAHLYLADPLEGYSFVPANMVKVDFAFWTGKNIVAIEVDGGSHIGSEAHVRKDRLLRRAGVDVIHILNSELSRHGGKVITRLLPQPVTEFWTSAGQAQPYEPLALGF